MTYTPKIDTTRENAERIMWLIHESKAGQKVRTKTMALIRTLLDERDLAVAREAAAWQAGIAALLDDVGRLPISEIAADEVIYAAKLLQPPPDNQAALDRLIAERVRDSLTEYYGERCPEDFPGCPTCMAWDWFDGFAPVAARGSKEGRGDGRT